MDTKLQTGLHRLSSPRHLEFHLSAYTVPLPSVSPGVFIFCLLISLLPACTPFPMHSNITIFSVWLCEGKGGSQKGIWRGSGSHFSFFTAVLLLHGAKKKLLENVLPKSMSHPHFCRGYTTAGESFFHGTASECSL